MSLEILFSTLFSGMPCSTWLMSTRLLNQSSWMMSSGTVRNQSQILVSFFSFTLWHSFLTDWFKASYCLTLWRWYFLASDCTFIHAAMSDLFQPKTSTFSTRALIWVHFKTVQYFSQPIFRIFSYLKIHNTIYSLNFVVRYFVFKNTEQVYIHFTHSFLPIELLTFCKNAKKLFYCSRDLSLFRPNKYYSLCR